MRSFAVLPHTADVRIHLEADSLEELLASGLEGMNAILKEGFCKAGDVLGRLVQDGQVGGNRLVDVIDVALEDLSDAAPELRRGKIRDRAHGFQSPTNATARQNAASPPLNFHGKQPRISRLF